ncbi:ribbon-helix-helix domain-containing protein [Candidatus Methanomassiliicoccus intestinalis]|uniref:ribbon-helix-helix domain-containing protein n=1 Tax=Candidatus Methanomassiliicoccus intestinalis TaxID=1406512 RepID=UPI0037DDB488
MAKTNMTITIPEQLISRIDEEVSKNGYSSREELILFILRYYFDKNGKITTPMI